MNASKKVISSILIAAIVPVLFVLIWEISGQSGLINTSVLSMPSSILKKWLDMFESGKFQTYLIVSFGRFLKGFILGTVCGLVLGTLMGLSKKADKLLGAMMSLLRSIPLVAWVPIAILSLGIGENTKILLVAIGSFWSVFLNTMDGIKGVDFKYFEVARILEKRQLTVITKVVFPAAFPSIVTGLRAGFSNSWRAIVAAEMIGASSGIGYIITYARENSRPDMMYVGLITVAVIGLIIDLILVKLQKKMMSRYNHSF